jgi:Ca2+/Na+ antiporter
LGAFFEVIVAIAVIGTAVTLFPIVKKQNESIALGYVAGRITESMIIIVGIISLVSVVTLRQGFAGATSANAPSYVAVGKAFVAIHNWTFLFGPSLAIGVNTLLLAYLMFKSRLVPRIIPVLGLTEAL